MHEKLTPWAIIGLIVLVLALAFFQLGQQYVSKEVHKISVTGSAEKEVSPDQVILTLAIVTQGDEAKAVQEKNAAAMAQVQKALKEAGVKDEEMETSGYNLYPWQDWDGQKTINKGYRLSHTLTITTSQILKAGELLDVAVKNGANEVNNVAFSLSAGTQSEIKSTLTKEATAQAKEKAQNLASSLNAELGDVLYVTENSYSGGPWYYAKAMTPESSAPTQISPQQVKVNLQVQVDFEIE